MSKASDVTDAGFSDFIGNNNVALIDCWAPWCGPCRMIAPLIDELAGDYDGRVAFGKLNTDENMETAKSMGIVSIPTLLIFKGGNLVDKLVGAIPKSNIEAALNRQL